MSALAVAATMLAVVLGSSSARVGGQGQPAPILLVVNTAAPNPYGAYLAEILRAEGIQSFSTVALSAIDAGTLGGAKLVVLAETALSPSQVTLLTSYVNGGGRLLAMKPDAQLAPLLGISVLAPTTTNGYVLVNQSGPGAGLQSVTLPFRGMAANYALAGATEVAALYSSRTTAVGVPAVVTFGRTAAWSFDLARSTAYTRQGDPAFAGQERDGLPIIRPADMFYGNIDLQRVGLPHADVQMRLFSRVIQSLLTDSQPLPRLWYFPGTNRTLLVTTADSHVSTLANYTSLISSAESHGARLSLYFSRFITMPSAASTWRANGHELGLHPFMTPDGVDFPTGYQTAQNWFSTTGLAPASPTVRHHAVEWLGWTDPLPTMIANNIRMDTSYYGAGPVMYNPTQQSQAHGYMTGSGLPMRFVSSTGSVFPVYQQATQIIDEQLVVGDISESLSTNAALAATQQLVDDSQNGGYSAFTTQFHVDYYPSVSDWVDGTFAYAQSLNIPMWSTQHWLTFNEARAATAFTNMAWSDPQRSLTFDVTVPAGAEAQTVLLPATFAGGALTSVLVAGQPATTTALTVNGQSTRAVTVTAAGGATRTIVVVYASSTPSVSITDASVTEGNSGTTSTSLTVTLSSSTSNAVSVAYTTSSGTALAGSDYTSASGTVNFAPFQTSQTIPLAIVGDTNPESTEQFSVVLSNPVNASLGDSVGIVTILDNDSLPGLSVNDVSITEGDSGTSSATFTVTLSSPSASTVSASYATANGTATAGSDYTGATGTVTFAPGVTSQPVIVPVIGDMQVEADETFTLNLSNAVGGVLTDAQGTGTIVNDDSAAATQPIVLIVNSASANPFGAYLGEILRAEGINSFSVLQLSALSGGAIQNARLVVLSETSLSSGQASILDDYVQSGGRLVAMRPDAQLASTLGVSVQAGSTTNGYLLINQNGAGAGLQAMTLPLKGVAAHYGLAGATEVAALYTNRTTAAGRPAVVTFGRTATWAFDLARSVAYTRQGDPAFAGLNRDNTAELTTGDIFYQNIDLQRVDVPHADVQMRLFSRVIQALLADAQPLPRLWYFPGAARTLLLATADAHTTTTSSYDSLVAQIASYGGRLSLYPARFLSYPTSAKVAQWRAAGHEVGLHPYMTPDSATIPQGYQNALNWFTTAGWLPPSATERHHTSEWTNWIDPVATMQSYGIRMDLSYYTIGETMYNPTQQSQAHGYMTGSGLPMRFVGTDGVARPVYQQLTSLSDEQLLNGSWTEGLTTAQAITVTRGMFDASLQGGYSAIAAQFHVDSSQYDGIQPWIDATLAYAQANAVPIWTAERWLNYTEARAATLLQNTAWDPSTRVLTLAVTVPQGAEAQSLMLPDTFAGQSFVSVTLDGQLGATATASINGVNTRFLTVPAGSHVISAVYDPATPQLPLMSISDVSVLEGNGGTTVANFVVSLSAPSSQTVTVAYATSAGTATAGSDYTSASGTVTFAPGTTQQPIPVTVSGDTVVESDETFTVTLSNQTNAVLADSQGTATITNDDVAPTLSIADASVTEGNAGPTTATFLVSLANGSGSTVTVGYATSDGTATAGSDYTATSGTLTFNPGITQLPVNVTVLGDTVVEGDEAFTVTLGSPVNAIIGDGQATGTIANDDVPSGPVSATFPVVSGADDVNEAGTTFTADGTSVWVGAGATPSTSYAGLRFTNVAIPAGATITSARLDLRAASTQWLTLNFEFAAEASPNSAAFSTTARPSQRTLLAPRVTHSSDAQWVSGTRYQLDEIATLLQAAIGQPGWASGNAVALVLRGSGQAWARKFASAFESGAANAPRLVVTYTVSQPSLPTLSINDVAVTEGDAGSANATFTITLSSASAQTVTVAYATSNGTAAAGSDYTATSGTATFNPGVTTQTVAVPVAGDTANEANETYTVTLSGPTNATIADGSGAGTITNDDAAPSLTVDDVTVTEGNAGAANATFTVTLTPASGQTVTVAYATANGTATAGSDYTATSGTLTFTPGVITQVINVPVLGDTAPEANETYTVTLSAPTNATIADGSGTGTITDDEGSALAITDAAVTEGNAGSTNATFTVTLSPANGQTVTVAYTTANGTATAGSDYTTTSGTLTFTPGVTTQTISVPVLGDVLDEANETYTVTLSAPTNAAIADGSGTGTITDDDAAPSLTIDDVTVTEGNAGSTNATFTVTLTPASGQTVTVAYATANGTGTAGSDYTAASGTLTFTPGVTTQTITVPVLGDVSDEVNETYTVALSAPANATIADGSGAGTITDDDAASSLTINDVAVVEGNAGSTNAAFTVTLAPASGQVVTVAYTTANGTATAGTDFTSTSGTLTFNPGVTTQAITVPVLGDVSDEVNETYTVTLSGPSNATIADDSGAGTITDDDAAPSLTINDVAVVEGNAGSTNAVFTVTLAPASGQTVTVAYATANGTATAGSDYTTTAGTLTFAPGVTTQTIAVPVLGDTAAEGNEAYTVTLSTPTNATIADGSGAGTITDDEGSLLSVNDVTVAEGNTGTRNATFTVTLAPASAQTVTVAWATSNATATAGTDYTAGSGTLSFTPGATTRTFNVVVRGDTLDEANETYTVTLSTPTNATIADGTGVGTITDDDASPTLAINDVALAEGNAGSANATFTVTLSAASGQTVTVGYATANGTATAGTDYTATSGTLTFAPGVTTQPVQVPVLGDALDEANETYTVTLSTPTNATIADGSGAGTISDDDATPTLVINDVTVVEGNAGATTAGFTVTLSAASGQTVTVAYATSNGTATAGADYTTTSGTLTFTPGTTTQPVNVPVLGETVPEGNETFTVTLSAPVNATIADATGVGTITNDDVGVSALSINDVTVAEGDAGTTNAVFTVSLSPASAGTVTVAFATSNGTATAGSDYTAASGTLTFAPGVLTQTVTVPVLGDTAVEPSETFTVTLTAPTNATLLDDQGAGTITNDDASGGPVTATFSVASGADDVVEDGTALTSDQATVWVGNGSTAATSYTGLRFSGVTIPAGATITSAHLELNSSATQWITLAFDFAAEASANSAPFSTTSRPSQRTLLAPRVNHSSDGPWTTGTWYALDSLTTVVQAVVAQPGWASGNAIGLVLHGTGQAWARKFARAAEAGAATAPRLVVTYTTP